MEKLQGELLLRAAVPTQTFTNPESYQCRLEGLGLYCLFVGMERIPSHVLGK